MSAGPTSPSARLPSLSVVIITKDEAPRLSLVLSSLRAAVAAPADLAFEVVVVDDGSSDQTQEVLAAHRDRLPLVCVRHEQARGRSAARNAGGAAASGDVLLFLDGDCLAGPGLATAHAQRHAEGAVIGRGETFHLRSTRFFADPTRGIANPGQEDRVRRMSAAELARALVTPEDVEQHFDKVAARAEPGIYPGAGPRQLFELEMRALRASTGSSVLWMAVAAQNLSLPRVPFLEVGGFDDRITINEHRELALRLCERGLRVVPVEGARTYHLTHRIGWRDPLTADPEWERAFYERHPSTATKLMQIFWQSLAGDPDIPEEARILSLEQLDEVVRGGSSFDYDGLRRTHPRLQPLGR